MLKEFECRDCSRNTFHDEYYMVHDKLWHQCVPDKKGMLCISCLESRLGRELSADDFPNVAINDIDILPWKASDLLMRRIKGK